MQTVMTSHSFSAVGALSATGLHLDQHVRVLYRATKKPGETTLRATFDGRYLSKVRSAEARLDAAFLPLAILRHMRSWLFGRLAPHFGTEFYRTTVTNWIAWIGAVVLVVVLPVLGALAVGNDIFDAVSTWLERGDSGEQGSVLKIHQVVSAISICSIMLALFLAIYIGSTRLFSRRARKFPGIAAYEYGAIQRKYPVTSIGLGLAGSTMFLGSLWLFGRVV